MASDDSGGGFVTGFLIGGIVGAAIGMLLAPKPGTQTRAELAEQRQIWKERAEELAARVIDSAGPTVDKLRERVGPITERMMSRLDKETDETPGRVVSDRASQKTKSTSA